MSGLERLVTIWLCGDNGCRARLEPVQGRHVYHCPSCGREWDAMKRWELNSEVLWLTTHSSPSVAVDVTVT